MKTSKVTCYYDDNDQFIYALVVRPDGKRLKVKKGSQYIVDPNNPQKKKHRGRMVIVNGVDEQYGKALVNFMDNGKRGKIPFSELNKINT